MLLFVVIGCLVVSVVLKSKKNENEFGYSGLGRAENHGCYVKKWWSLYPLKNNWSYNHLAGNRSSITNDEVALLDERLQFFLPKFTEMLSFFQWMFYLLCWSLFLTVLGRETLDGWSEFVFRFCYVTVVLMLSLIPPVIFIEYWRPQLRRLDTVQVCVRIWLVMCVNAALAFIVVKGSLIALDVIISSMTEFCLSLLFHVVITGGFTIVFLLYFLRRHQEMTALKRSFERKLAAQNDLIKARIAPHFFFNMVNSMVSLVETDTTKASELLEHASILFRASFKEPREVSFEEEIEICEHYLAIEKIRLADKLEITWDLPDDDTLYDMVITGMTLQSTIEQILLHVVEMTTERIHIHTAVSWNNHRVRIVISVDLPQKTLLISHDLHKQIDSRIQADRLQQHFGRTAHIQHVIDSHQLISTITYPLHDPIMAS